MTSIDVRNVVKSDAKPAANSAGKTPKKAKKIFSLRNIVLAALFLLAVASSVFFYMKYRDATSNPSETLAERNKVESQDVVDALKRVLFVEGDTAPTVIRVENAEAQKAKNPEFYKNLADKDYIIVYPTRAIIFRSTENKIINIAPILDSSKINTSSADDTTSDQKTTTTKKP